MDLDSPKYPQWESNLCDTFGIFFCELDKDLLITSEKNQTILRKLITSTKPSLFIVDSLHSFPFSPTIISEFIIFIIKNQIPFQSDDENIYFDLVFAF